MARHNAPSNLDSIPWPLSFKNVACLANHWWQLSSDPASHSGLVLVQVGEGGGAWQVQRCTGNASVGSKVTLWACWTAGPGSLGMESSQLDLDPEEN